MRDLDVEARLRRLEVCAGEADRRCADRGVDRDPAPQDRERRPAGPADRHLEIGGEALPGYDEVELDRVSRRVATDSAGLPLLAVELLHAVALGLDLHSTGGAWPEPFRTLDQSLPGDLPDAVAAAVRVGFRRLSGDAQSVLAAAAVLGDRVAADALQRATGLDNAALAVALDELEWQRWLTAEARGYSFFARIVRDVVARDMLTGGQRERILKAAGE